MPGRPADQRGKVYVEEADFSATMAELKHYAVQRGIRAKNFIQDFDPLRTGYVTPEQMMRAAKGMCPDLTAGQCQAVANGYRDVSRGPPRVCCWRNFAADVDNVFVGGHLDKVSGHATRLLSNQTMPD